MKDKTRHKPSLSHSQEDVLEYWTCANLKPGSSNTTEVIKLNGKEISVAISEKLGEGDDTNDSTLKISKLDTAKENRPPLTPRTKCSYNLRQYITKSYDSFDESHIDDAENEFIYCKECENYTIGMCSRHIALVLNRKVDRDGSVEDRAKLTTPWPLHISKSAIPKAGLGVWTRSDLPLGLAFGPYEGRILINNIQRKDSGYAWHMKTYLKNKRVVDSQDKTFSNWLRYVNCARNMNELNLEAFQFKGNIYYKNLKHIPKDTELLVWYGDEFGKDLGITNFSYIIPSIPQSPGTSNGCIDNKKNSETKIGGHGQQWSLSAPQEAFLHIFNPIQLQPSEDGSVEVVKDDSRKNVPIPLLSSAKPTSKKSKSNNNTYCVKCKKAYKWICKQHPMNLVLDKPVRRDGSVKNRAFLTAPWPLMIGGSQVTGAGLGVLTSATLPPGLVFGPCEGKIIKKSDDTTGYGWEIRGRPDIEIDSKDTSTSNWTRYINCARNYVERNLIAMQINEEIFYVTSNTILGGKELLVWYGNTYGKWLGISMNDFFRSNSKDQHKWKCKKCGIVFFSEESIVSHRPNCPRTLNFPVSSSTQTDDKNPCPSKTQSTEHLKQPTMGVDSEAEEPHGKSNQVNESMVAQKQLFEIKRELGQGKFKENYLQNYSKLGTSLSIQGKTSGSSFETDHESLNTQNLTNAYDMHHGHLSRSTISPCTSKTRSREYQKKSTRRVDSEAEKPRGKSNQVNESMVAQKQLLKVKRELAQREVEKNYKYLYSKLGTSFSTHDKTESDHESLNTKNMTNTYDMHHGHLSKSTRSTCPSKTQPKEHLKQYTRTVISEAGKPRGKSNQVNESMVAQKQLLKVKRELRQREVEENYLQNYSKLGTSFSTQGKTISFPSESDHESLNTPNLTNTYDMHQGHVSRSTKNLCPSKTRPKERQKETTMRVDSEVEKPRGKSNQVNESRVAQKQLLKVKRELRQREVEENYYKYLYSKLGTSFTTHDETGSSSSESDHESLNTQNLTNTYDMHHGHFSKSTRNPCPSETQPNEHQKQSTRRMVYEAGNPHGKSNRVNKSMVGLAQKQMLKIKRELGKRKVEENYLRNHPKLGTSFNTQGETGNSSSESDVESLTTLNLTNTNKFNKIHHLNKFTALEFYDADSSSETSDSSSTINGGYKTPVRSKKRPVLNKGRKFTTSKRIRSNRNLSPNHKCCSCVTGRKKVNKYRRSTKGQTSEITKNINSYVRNYLANRQHKNNHIGRVHHANKRNISDRANGMHVTPRSLIRYPSSRNKTENSLKSRPSTDSGISHSSVDHRQFSGISPMERTEHVQGYRKQGRHGKNQFVVANKQRSGLDQQGDISSIRSKKHHIRTVIDDYSQNKKAKYSERQEGKILSHKNLSSFNSHMSNRMITSQVERNYQIETCTQTKVTRTVNERHFFDNQENFDVDQHTSGSAHSDNTMDITRRGNFSEATNDSDFDYKDDEKGYEVNSYKDRTLLVEDDSQSKEAMLKPKLKIQHCSSNTNIMRDISPRHSNTVSYSRASTASKGMLNNTLSSLSNNKNVYKSENGKSHSSVSKPNTSTRDLDPSTVNCLGNKLIHCSKCGMNFMTKYNFFEHKNIGCVN